MLCDMPYPRDPSQLPLAFLAIFKPAIQQRQREVALGCPSPTEQPVRYFLVQAWLRRVDALLDGLRGELWQIPVRQIGPELLQLESWLGFNESEKAENTRKFGGLDGLGDWLVFNGASFAEAQRLLKLFKAGRKGAPPRHRASTVCALDQKLSRNWSWATLTEGVCTCGRKHKEQCEDRLRKRIGELEAMLKTYGWQLFGKSTAA